MAKKKRKKNMEFSKKLVIAVGIINVVVIGFSVALMWRTMDTTPLAYLIPAVSAEMATASGFYLSKARRENILKIMKSNGMEINENTIHNLLN
jgi:uncharacterized membrane protein